MSGLIIRQYTKGDEAGIVHLLKAVFSGWPSFDIPCSPLDHWKWKYLDQPIKSNEIGVAELDGEIIGCNHTIYYKSVLHGNEYVARQGCDLAVHPDHRGKGIYKRINEVREKIRIGSNAKIEYFSTDNPIVIQS